MAGFASGLARGLQRGFDRKQKQAELDRQDKLAKLHGQTLQLQLEQAARKQTAIDKFAATGQPQPAPPGVAGLDPNVPIPLQNAGEIGAENESRASMGILERLSQNPGIAAGLASTGALKGFTDLAGLQQKTQMQQMIQQLLGGGAGGAGQPGGAGGDTRVKGFSVDSTGGTKVNFGPPQTVVQEFENPDGSKSAWIINKQTGERIAPVGGGNFPTSPGAAFSGVTSRAPASEAIPLPQLQNMVIFDEQGNPEPLEIGTTFEQARKKGAVVMSAAAQKDLKNMQQAMTAIDKLELLGLGDPNDPESRGIFTFEKKAGAGLVGNLVDKAKFSAGLGMKLFEDDPNVVQFRDLSEGLLSTFIKGLGESGTLNEGDIGRARSLLGSMFNSFGLSSGRATMVKKFKDLRDLLSAKVPKAIRNRSTLPSDPRKAIKTKSKPVKLNMLPAQQQMEALQLMMQQLQEQLDGQ